MSGIADRLGGIWDGIKAIPGQIIDGISSWLSNIYDNLLSLPGAILDGLKEIFIPDTDDIESTFNATVDAISARFGFQKFNLDTLFGTSSAPKDENHNYNIPGVGNLRLKFLDTSYLIQGVEYFRPFIRGFIVLLLLFFNFRNFLGFIGHNLGDKTEKGDTKE